TGWSRHRHRCWYDANPGALRKNGVEKPDPDVVRSSDDAEQSRPLWPHDGRRVLPVRARKEGCEGAAARLQGPLFLRYFDEILWYRSVRMGLINDLIWP
ncbi:hypothetical protein PENTCL1PPCAC_21213, partial [Pristionchus entomophagus]